MQPKGPPLIGIPIKWTLIRTATSSIQCAEIQMWIAQHWPEMVVHVEYYHGKFLIYVGKVMQ